MTDHIHQELVFDSAPARIYEALTDAAQFSKLCGGAPTEIEAAAGGAFSCFGGLLLGRHIECAPGERLVQAWRVKTWDPGVYSIVRFELRPEGKSTRVLLDHAGFPEGQGEHLAKGWHANYWEPMRKALA
jgi:activator of HSP90 ATPase